jgi:secondary thiamine-phosphate synthase enzyme
MRQAIHQLTIETRGKGLTEFTRSVAAWLDREKARDGLVTLFCRHTSCSLLIQENADPDVRADLTDWFEQAAPEEAVYIHTTEGPDDMPAHIRAAITATSLSIPVSGGAMTLGTWQGVYVFEHRRAPHRRQVVLHFFGD